jgi:hypothetical protein
MILCEPLKLDSTIDPFKDTKNPFESCYSCLKTITLETKKYCNQVCHKILMFEGRIVKLQIQQVLKKIVKNPWNQNTYYHKKKHIKKHWKKERNRRTTCETTTCVVVVATTIGCLPKHTKKLVVTFTCEGKPCLLWNINIQESWFYITFVTLHNIPSQITVPFLYPMHFTFLASKQTNKQAHKINVGM